MTTTYTGTYHTNSNRAKKRGLCGLVWNKVKRIHEWRNHHSLQMFRDQEGIPAETMHSKAVKRSWCSKYAPHIGKKQQAKIDAKKIA